MLLRGIYIKRRATSLLSVSNTTTASHGPSAARHFDEDDAAFSYRHGARHFAARYKPEVMRKRYPSFTGLSRQLRYRHALAEAPPPSELFAKQAYSRPDNSAALVASTRS